jgi:hypothetical protein
MNMVERWWRADEDQLRAAVWGLAGLLHPQASHPSDRTPNLPPNSQKPR